MTLRDCFCLYFFRIAVRKDSAGKFAWSPKPYGFGEICRGRAPKGKSAAGADFPVLKNGYVKKTPYETLPKIGMENTFSFFLRRARAVRLEQTCKI